MYYVCVLTIKAAALATGVPEATLRAWERRYGLSAPARSSGGYRLYDEASIARIQAVKGLVDAGWTPQQAAAHLLDAPKNATAARAGEVYLGAATEPFLNAAGAMDDLTMNAVLDDIWTRAPFERLVDEWLLPMLTELGERWARGVLDIAAEHFAAAVVQRRLMVELHSARSWSSGPRVVVGLGPGSRHELGVVAFAVVACRAGFDVRYLGPDLPPKVWAAAVQDMSADAVVVGVPLGTDVDGVRAVVDAVHVAMPDVTVAVGGAHQDDIGAPAVALGHQMHPAVHLLADALGIPVVDGALDLTHTARLTAGVSA